MPQDPFVLGALLAILALGVILVAMLRRLLQGADKDADLARIERKLDLLLAAQDIRYDPLEGLPMAIEVLVKQGKTIEAIKLYREARGVGLKAAKDAIDEIRRLQS